MVYHPQVLLIRSSRFTAVHTCDDAATESEKKPPVEPSLLSWKWLDSIITACSVAGGSGSSPDL